jgi:5-methylcytosine-specific restriction endonuclease McrA
LTKTCSRCEQEKPITEFWTNGMSVKGEPRYRSRCIPCRRAEKREEYQANRDKIRAGSKAKWPEVRERENARRRAYYIEKNEAEKQRIRYATDEEYAAKKRTRVRTRKAARNKNRYGTVGHHTRKDWLRLLNQHDGRCAYCDAPADHKDHVVPLVRGGSDSIGNLLPACRKCNLSKGGKLLIEWRPLRG